VLEPTRSTGTMGDDADESMPLADQLGALVSSSDDDDSDPSPADDMRARLAAALAGSDDDDDDDIDIDDAEEDAEIDALLAGSEARRGGDSKRDTARYSLGAPEPVDGADAMQRLSPVTLGDDKTEDTDFGLLSLTADDGDGQAMYSQEFLESQAQSALRRLARQHKIALSGGRDAIIKRLGDLRGKAPEVPEAALKANPVRDGTGADTGRAPGRRAARSRRRVRTVEPESDDEGGDDEGGDDSTADIRMLTDAESTDGPPLREVEDGSSADIGMLTETDGGSTADVQMLLSSADEGGRAANNHGIHGGGGDDDDSDSDSDDDDTGRDDVRVPDIVRRACFDRCLGPHVKCV